MDIQYRLNIPTISDFQVQYYFNNGTKLIPPKSYPPHIDDYVEIYVLLKGDVSFMVEQSLYKLSAGDAIVTKPNEIHNCILNSPSLHQHICFWLSPDCEFLLSDFLAHEAGAGNLVSPDDAHKKRLFAIYDDLQKASEEKRTRKQFYLVLEMLEIFREFLPENNFNAYLPMPNELRVILEDVKENFASIRSLEYFTEKYFISQSTLNRLFKTHLHTTPSLYLESKKLARSRVLLKEGKSVLAACMESGFTDYSGYIRLFKKRFSVTPRQYRDG